MAESTLAPFTTHEDCDPIRIRVRTELDEFEKNITDNFGPKYTGRPKSIESYIQYMRPLLMRVLEKLECLEHRVIVMHSEISQMKTQMETTSIIRGETRKR